MFEQLNEVALLVSALLALAIGSIWYSPLCFGLIWKQLRGSTDSVTRSPRVLALILGCGAMAVIASGAIQILLIHAVGAGTLTLVAFLGTLLLFIGAPWYAVTLSEGRAPQYALLHFGYVALSIVVSAVVSTYWPW